MMVADVPGSGTAEPADPETKDWVDRIRGRHLALLFLALVLPGLGSTPLTEPDEGRYAEIPREMLASEDFVTPRLDEVLYLEKPPLYYWLVAGSFTVLGIHEFSARLISVLAGLAGVLLTFSLGSSMAGKRAGSYAGLILATSPLWTGFARLNVIDMTLSALILASLAAYWWAQRSERNQTGPFSRQPVAWLALFGFSALAVLAKGLIGIVIPGAVIFFFILATGGWKQLRRVPWLSGLLVFGIVAIPWHVLAAQRNPKFLWFYFVHEHLLRYTTDVAARPGPFWYFVPVVFLGMLPWAGLLPAAGWNLTRHRSSEHRREVLFLGIWFGFIFLFFSASSSKLVPYLLPAFPALAILMALAFVNLERRMNRRTPWAILALSSLPAAGLFATFVWFGSGRGDAQLRDVSIDLPLLVAAGSLGLLAVILSVVVCFRRQLRRVVPAQLAIGILLSWCLAQGLLPVAEVRSSKDLARCIAEQPDGDLAAYRAYPQSLPVYLERTMTLVDFWGELEFGRSQLSEEERQERFPSVAEFRRRWEGERLVYLVVERRHLESLREAGLDADIVLRTERKHALLVNRQGKGVHSCESF